MSGGKSRETKKFLTIRVTLGWLPLRGNESVGVENIGFGVYFRVMEIMPVMNTRQSFFLHRRF